MSFIEYLTEVDLMEAYLNEKKLSDSEIKALKIENISPETKDIERANKMTSPQKATAQAKAITDPVKLVRRLKAVLSVHGVGDYSNPFKNKMADLGFTNAQIKSIDKSNLLIAPKKALRSPVRRAGKDFEKSRGKSRTIMNASTVYKGKLSNVIKDLTYGRSVILLGKMNGRSKVAVIGSASLMKDKMNGLDYYQIPKDGELVHKYDTGNGYRDSNNRLIITDYVLVDNGEAITDYYDQSYRYFVFK